jgi:glyoxylate reductase
MIAMERRPPVFVSRDLPGDALSRLAEKTEMRLWQGDGAPPPEALREGARDAEGLLCLLTDRIDASLLDACPQLRVLSSCSVGLDHVDLGEATRRGIPVGHTPGVLTETTAEFAFALLLAAARRVPEADRFVREGRWTPARSWEPDLLLGRDLHGASLGIVGLGAVGRSVARRASGFGMRVRGWSRSPGEVPGVERVALPELLSASDFLSIHVALTSETRGLIGADEIARMPRGAVLVNTARGGIVDEAALLAALESGQLSSAALDVFACEPLPAASPLRRAPHLVLAPHIGSASIATRSRMADLAVENLLAGLQGRPMPACANPEVSAAAGRADPVVE